MSPPRITVNYPAETVFGTAFRRVCRLLGKIAASDASSHRGPLSPDVPRPTIPAW